MSSHLAGVYNSHIFLRASHPDVEFVGRHDVLLARTFPRITGESFLKKSWSDAVILAGANCLSFALDREDFGLAHPHLSFLNANATDDSGGKVAVIRDAFRKSGFLRVREHNISRDRHIIAVVATLGNADGTGADFHCYRLSGDGWLHKPASYVSGNDCSGQPIANPRECDRKEYTEFLGYYTIPQKGVSVICCARP